MDGRILDRFIIQAKNRILLRYCRQSSPAVPACHLRAVAPPPPPPSTLVDTCYAPFYRRPLDRSGWVMGMVTRGYVSDGEDVGDVGDGDAL